MRVICLLINSKVIFVLDNLYNIYNGVKDSDSNDLIVHEDVNEILYQEKDRGGIVVVISDVSIINTDRISKLRIKIIYENFLEVINIGEVEIGIVI